jgi:hypothetical protein
VADDGEEAGARCCGAPAVVVATGSFNELEDSGADIELGAATLAPQPEDGECIATRVRLGHLRLFNVAGST